MLGLAYNEATGRMSVEVVKGSSFKNLASSKAPGLLLSYCMFTIIIHADDSPGNKAFSSVFARVCVRTIKPKRQKLQPPNLPQG